MTVQNYAAAVLIAAAAPVARTADTATRYGTAVRALTAHQVFRAVLGNKYISIAATDVPKIVPAGYRLAVFRVPLVRKVRLTLWLDPNGRIGRRRNR